MHLQEKTLFDLWVKVTRNVVPYSLHHVGYAPVKFEVAMSNGLGGDIRIRRNVTRGRTDRRWTNFGTKLIYPFFLRV